MGGVSNFTKSYYKKERLRQKHSSSIINEDMSEVLFSDIQSKKVETKKESSGNSPITPNIPYKKQVHLSVDSILEVSNNENI
jgi:hypothetical protein